MNRKRISTNFYALAYGLAGAALCFRNWLFHYFRNWLFHYWNWLFRYYGSEYYIGPGMFIGRSILATLLWVFVIVVLLTFIYRVWKAIQDGHASTSPAAAAWLLLIPVFQLYWVFRAVWGFARDYNQFLERRGLELRKLPERLYLAASILLAAKWTYLTVGTLQPFFKGMRLLGPYSRILTICALALTLIVIVKSAQAINALPEPAAELRRAGEQEEVPTNGPNDHE